MVKTVLHLLNHKFLYKTKKTPKSQKQINITRLQDPVVLNRFQEAIDEHLKIISDANWLKSRKHIQNILQDILGYKPPMSRRINRYDDHNLNELLDERANLLNCLQTDTTLSKNRIQKIHKDWQKLMKKIKKRCLDLYHESVSSMIDEIATTFATC